VVEEINTGELVGGGGTYADDVLVGAAEEDATDSCPPFSHTSVPFAMPWRTSSSVMGWPFST